MISGPRSALLEPEPNSKIHRRFQARKCPELAWRTRVGDCRRPHQRHRGTGIWLDRDIAAGWPAVHGARESLPTMPRAQPRTPAGEGGILELRKRFRARDRLSAGGRWIRTLGPPSGGHPGLYRL